MSTRHTHTTVTGNKRVLEPYIESILLYSSDTLTMDKQSEERIKAAQMCFLRKRFRIPSTARKTKEEQQNISNFWPYIRKRQSQFFRNISRLVMTGKIWQATKMAKKTEIAGWLNCRGSTENNS